jgi:HlyD family secretion protein
MSGTSAHPSIKLRWFTRNRILAILAAAVLLSAGGAGYALWRSNQAAGATPESTLQTATVRRGNIKLAATGTGTLVAASEATFGFRTSGTVAEVLVEVGDAVAAGDPLARLDDADARLALQQAQRALSELTSDAAVAAANLSVAEAKVNVVTTKATLAYLISPAVVYWEEEVAKAEKALADAQTEAAADPSADADKKVADAQQQLQVCKNRLAQAWLDYWNDYVPATFLTYITEGRTTKKTVISPSNEDVAQARADYTLAKLTLQEAEWYLTAITTGEIPEGATGSSLAAYRQALEDVTAAQEALDATILVAPIHGTVMSIGFQKGDSADSGSAVTISDLDQPYRLEVFLDESDWGNVRTGYPIEVTFDLLPDNVYSGKVVSVDPGLSSSSGSAYVHAYVQLDSPVASALPLGTSASVDVIGGQAQGVLLIPVEALHEIADGKYAVFVMENGSPRMRQVEIGLQDLVSVEIKSGLSEGEEVTTGLSETSG